MTADVDPHERAVELVRAVVASETAANNPDLVWPDLAPDQYPDFWGLLAEAQQALNRHLHEHRGVLGADPRWRLDYALIDHPPPPAPLESRWRAEELQIAVPHDDPPF